MHDLREDGFLTLGLVATDDEGQVVGYVAFSPVDVQGEDLQWVGMAPLAVDENYRGQGLARQLVYEGLDSLNEFGYAAVVTLGIRPCTAALALSWRPIMTCVAAGRAPKARSRFIAWRTMRWMA